MGKVIVFPQLEDLKESVDFDELFKTIKPYFTRCLV